LHPQPFWEGWVLSHRCPDREGDEIAVVEAGHRREVRADNRADLARHGGEQLARRNVLRHQRRHAPQRGLFLGNPPGFGARRHVRLRGAVVR
jgi:hypothetical protein